MKLFKQSDPEELVLDLDTDDCPPWPQGTEQRELPQLGPSHLNTLKVGRLWRPDYLVAMTKPVTFHMQGSLGPRAGGGGGGRGEGAWN